MHKNASRCLKTRLNGIAGLRQIHKFTRYQGNAILSTLPSYQAYQSIKIIKPITPANIILPMCKRVSTTA